MDGVEQGRKFGLFESVEVLTKVSSNSSKVSSYQSHDGVQLPPVLRDPVLHDSIDPYQRYFSLGMYMEELLPLFLFFWIACCVSLAALVEASLGVRSFTENGIYDEPLIVQLKILKKHLLDNSVKFLDVTSQAVRGRAP
ncbi:unnamed protein product [Arabis nemorensis]|uniref:Uncharacterized protein n=1 Tax=Arabis nemorensis TaxID=586526 RepID=A0A565BML7_9BRAS|nr:unnamed protein product [Arabis nemorensis]